MTNSLGRGRNRPAKASGYGIGYCESAQKRAYQSRDDAKQARKVHHRGDGHVNAYQCEHAPHWHLGHLAVDVVDGNLARADVYEGGTDA